MHPRDSDERLRGFKTLYAGAAGVVWALQRLGRGERLAGVVPAIHDRYLADPDGGARAASYLVGEVGILLLDWKLQPSASVANRIYELVEANAESKENELFHGAPGTMIAAWWMARSTGQERWEALWLENARTLWSRWYLDPEYGCHLWIQNRKGRLLRSIGAGHGFASNVHSLLLGQELLEPGQRDELHRRAAETAGRLALVEDGLANWPTSADPFWAEQQPIKVQWCHGAPGLVTSLAGLERGESTDRLLAAAGELVWRAGPPVKTAGLCHGTAGNGYAFLKLWERTGEEVWLERARAFAMDAIGQYEAVRERFGRGWFSLWTGDLGLALYLWACLEGSADIPTMDTF